MSKSLRQKSRARNEGIRQGHPENLYLGVVNGLEQLLSHYDFQIRSGASWNAVDKREIREAVSGEICECAVEKSGASPAACCGLVDPRTPAQFLKR